MDVVELFIFMGIPTAFTGLLFWWLKRSIDKREKAKEKREQNIEKFMILMMQNIRATNILAKATAVAVQRIPDARCNGDMTSALAEAERIQKQEKEFVLTHGIEHIFEN